MNHAPVAFVRAAPGKPWVRYDGFASPATLVQEYRTQIAKA
jgi:protein SCO1/2